MQRPLPQRQSRVPSASPRARPPAGPVPAGPVPNAQTLRAAALRHLARYGTTETGLVRVLDRRIDRWVRAVAGTAECDDSQVEAGARQAARQVARDLVAAGAIDDAAFAAGRVRSLARAGRSRRAIAAHLAAKGVPNGVAVLPDDPAAELAAALAYARRRRIGPFRVGEPPDGEPSDGEPPNEVPAAGLQMKDLARMARAGFTQGVAAAALRMDADTAEALMTAARLD